MVSAPSILLQDSLPISMTQGVLMMFGVLNKRFRGSPRTRFSTDSQHLIKNDDELQWFVAVWDFCASTVTLRVSRADFANGQWRDLFHSSTPVWPMILGVGLQSWTNTYRYHVHCTTWQDRCDLTQSLDICESRKTQYVKVIPWRTCSKTKKKQQPHPHEPLWTLNRRTCHDMSIFGCVQK